MGLAVSVGQLAFLHTHDPEGVESLREAFRAVNRLLVSNGLPPHNEPESLPEIADRVPVGSMPYSWLHYVRRAVAYAMKPGRPFRPLREGEQPSEDPVYDDVLFSFRSHIVCHSDGEGFYVPIDFPEPLYDDLPDGDPECIEGGHLPFRRRSVDRCRSGPSPWLLIEDQAKDFAQVGWEAAAKRSEPAYSV